jgi:glycosyltransferase involved in cell wall biosynthesis
MTRGINDAGVTIVMPVYNGATTLRRVFASLEKQKHKAVVDKIVIINDNSSDDSLHIIEEYAKESSYVVQLIRHHKSAGLAKGYNEGIEVSSSNFVMTMHQDMELIDGESFSKMVASFGDKNVVAAYPVILHPYEVWKEYNFWQKCLFSRFVGKKQPALTGKFDCFRSSYLKEVGGFDSITYRTAGEDSDLKIKIANDGKIAADSGVEVVHLQYIEKNFSFKKLVRKEAQLAEAQGVILRKYGASKLKDTLMSHFRSILLIGLLIPYVNILFALLVIAYSFMYTKLVYKEEKGNPKLLILPFVNVYLLVVSFLASLRGFVVGKQRI